MLRHFCRVLGGVVSTTIVAKGKTPAVAAATGKAMGDLVPEQTTKEAETTGGEQTVSLLRQAQPLQQQQAHQQQSMLAQPEQVQPSPPREKRRPKKVAFKNYLLWPALYDPAVYFPNPHLQFVSCRAPSGPATGPWCFANDELRMVRQVYEAVWERYLEVLHSDHPNNGKGLLIIGHPGIGKTCLLDLLLSWHLFTNPQIPVVAVANRHC